MDQAFVLNQELHKVFYFRECFGLPSVLTSIPFICEIGIKLNSNLNYDGLMNDLESQFTKAKSCKKVVKLDKFPESDVDIKVSYFHSTYMCLVIACCYIGRE